MGNWISILTRSARYGLLTAAISPMAQAEEAPESIDTRHGAISGLSDIEVEAGTTVVAQGASDSDVDAELTASFDLLTQIPAGPGKIVVYAEGNTTPPSGGVSSLLGEANGDAGSGLDRDDNGRLQISEVHYIQSLNSHGELAIGLLDTTGSLDTNDVANDETSQFLAGPLVNNPSIEFPDYTLGGIYHHMISENLGVNLALTSSNGLGDNPKRSYSQLFDVSDDGKGIFAAIEAGWTVSDYTLRAGTWLNSADHDKLDGTSDSEDNYGVYANIDGGIGNGNWNIRLGAANEEVSQTARFASFAIEYPLGLPTVGLGIAHSWLSDDDNTPDLDDSTLVEIYARFEVIDQLSVTPSVQWLENSGFDASEAVYDDSLVVYGLRATATFL